ISVLKGHAAEKPADFFREVDRLTDAGNLELCFSFIFGFLNSEGHLATDEFIQKLILDEVVIAQLILRNVERGKLALSLFAIFLGCPNRVPDVAVFALKSQFQAKIAALCGSPSSV